MILRPSAASFASLRQASHKQDVGKLRVHQRFAIAGMSSPPRGTSCPSLAAVAALESAEGAGKAGCRLAPAVHCAMIALQEAAQRHTGEAKHPAFPAQWFDGLCRALPGERCTIAPVASRMADAETRSGQTHHRKTWRTDPGRQDHTILPYADHTGRARDASAHGYPPCEALRADLTHVHHVPSRVS